MPAAAAALAATDNLKIGTGVLLLPLHEPTESQTPQISQRQLRSTLSSRCRHGLSTRGISNQRSRHGNDYNLDAGLDVLEPATDTQTWLGISSQQRKSWLPQPGPIYLRALQSSQFAYRRSPKNMGKS